MAGKLIWLVLIIWLILFLLAKETLKMSGSPLVSFILLLVLFFVALFGVRFGIFRARRYWTAIKLFFNRFWLRLKRR